MLIRPVQKESERLQWRRFHKLKYEIHIFVHVISKFFIAILADLFYFLRATLKTFLKRWHCLLHYCIALLFIASSLKQYRSGNEVFIVKDYNQPRFYLSQ